MRGTFLSDPSGLESRHVVVTGGAGALGFAVVQHLCELGAVCHVPLRGAEPPEHLHKLDPERVRVAAVDVGRETDLEAFYSDLPGLWASVHCIGAFAAGGIADARLESARRLFEANLFSALACTRAAVMRMRRDGRGGRIVQVTARAGLEPRTAAGMATYAASKAALVALTEALGEELAGEGILVSAVAPSVMDTPANRAAQPAADHAKWPTTGEVAQAIAWLASPANTLVRSAIVPVYGKS